MYKLSGAVLIIIMTTYYGFYLSRQLNIRLNMIDAYIYSLDYMQSQIRYGLTPLPQICMELSRSINNDIVSKMYSDIYHELMDISGKERTFDEIWKTELDRLLKSGVAGKEEIAVISELGQVGTYIDRDMQIQCVGNVSLKLKNIYNRMLKDISAKTKIYKISGVMAGIIITILLI